MRPIDADALRDRLRNLADDEWNQSTTTSWAEAFAECADMVEDAPTIEPEQRWIPCSERVPEEDEQVLVYLYDSPYIAWIDSNGEWNTEDFTLDKEEDREDKPIAWMPMPTPYREGE